MDSPTFCSDALRHMLEEAVIGNPTLAYMTLCHEAARRFDIFVANASDCLDEAWTKVTPVAARDGGYGYGSLMTCVTHPIMREEISYHIEASLPINPITSLLVVTATRTLAVMEVSGLLMATDSLTSPTDPDQVCRLENSLKLYGRSKFSPAEMAAHTLTYHVRGGASPHLRPHIERVFNIHSQSNSHHLLNGFPYREASTLAEMWEVSIGMIANHMEMSCGYHPTLYREVVKDSIKVRTRCREFDRSSIISIFKRFAQLTKAVEFNDDMLVTYDQAMIKRMGCVPCSCPTFPCICWE